jgi:hypothetical protein
VVANDSLKRADAVDRLAIGSDDTSPGCRPAFFAGVLSSGKFRTVHHECPSRPRPRVFLAHIVNADAECRNAHATIGDKLVHHALCERDWNRKAIAAL